MPLGPSQRLARVTSGVAGQTVWVTCGRIVSNLALTAVAVVTARRLGVTGRGTFVLFVTVGTFTSLAANLGVPVSGRVHLVSGPRPVALGDYVGLCAVLALVSGLLSAGVGATALPFAGVRVTAQATVAIGFYGAGLLASRCGVAALAAYGHNRSAANHDAMGSVVRLVAILAVSQVDGVPVAAYLAALTFGDAFQVTTSLMALWRRQHGVMPRVSPANWRLMVRSGIPGVGIGLWQSLAFRVDRYLVGVLLSPASVGIYSVAGTVTEAIRLPGYGLGQVIFNRLASGKAGADDLRRARRWCLVATVSGAAAVWLVAPSIVRILFGKEFEGSIAPMRILLIAELALSSFLVDGLALVALRRPGRGALAALVALVTLVVADLVLVRQFGISGAAWASVLSYLIMAVMARIFLARAEWPTKNG